MRKGRDVSEEEKVKGNKNRNERSSSMSSRCSVSSSNRSSNRSRRKRLKYVIEVRAIRGAAKSCNLRGVLCHLSEGRGSE